MFKILGNQTFKNQNINKQKINYNYQKIDIIHNYKILTN